MVLNIAKLTLLTGFAVTASAKKGKDGYGYRKNEPTFAPTYEPTFEPTYEATRTCVATLEAPFQDASIYGPVCSSFGDADTCPGPLCRWSTERRRLLKKGKKGKKDKAGKKVKGKKGCNDPDFAKGVLASVADRIDMEESEGHQMTMEDVMDMLMLILGEDFSPEDSKAFEKGFEFGEEKLQEGAVTGCSAECVDAPFAPECQECCKTFNHRIDWNCDSTDDTKPAAECCTNWSEECYTTDSAENNNHACKDCYGYGGYGRGRGYGGYGRRYGRRRA